MLWLKTLLSLLLVGCATGNNPIKCDSELKSTETCGVTELVSPPLGEECFINMQNLSKNLESDDGNYTLYLKPGVNFLYVKVSFLDKNRNEVQNERIGRRELNLSTPDIQGSSKWHRLTLKKRISTTSNVYRWMVGDKQSSPISLHRKTSYLVLAAKGSLTWTDECDPRSSASIVRPLPQDAGEDAPTTDGVNAVIVALSGAAGIVIFILVVIIVVQNRRRAQGTDGGGGSSGEATATTTIDFPQRPAPPVPMTKAPYTMSPYAKVHDEADHFYEEVYGSVKRGQHFGGTQPFIMNPQLTLDGFPPKTKDEEFLRLENDKDGSASERSSINSLYMSAFDAV